LRVVGLCGWVVEPEEKKEIKRFLKKEPIFEQQVKKKGCCSNVKKKDF